MTQNPLMPVSSVNVQPESRSVAVTSRFSPVDHMRLFRQYVWLWIVAAVVGVALGVVVSLLCNYFVPRYTSISRLQVTGSLAEVFDAPLDPHEGGQLDALRTFINNMILTLKSPVVLDDTLKRPDVKDTEWFNSFHSAEDAYEDLYERVKAFRPRDSSIIEVKFSTPREKDAAIVLQAINQEFLRGYRRQLGNRDDDLRRMMSTERDRALEEMEAIRKDLTDFSEQNNIAVIRAEGSKEQIHYLTLVQTKAQLEMLLEMTKLNYTEEVRQGNDPQLNERPERAALQDQDPFIAEARVMIKRLKEFKANLIVKGFGPEHRQIKEIDRNILVKQNELNQSRTEMQRMASSIRLSAGQQELEGIYRQLASMGPQMAAADAQLRDLNLKIAEYEQMEERLVATQARHDRAAELLADIRVRSDRPDAVRVSVLQQPTVAELTFPNYPVMISGVALLVLTITVGWVYLTEMLDQRIKTPTDVNLVPDATLLGVIPMTTEDPSGPQAVEGVVQEDPSGLMAEAFRQVRTEIMARMDRRGYKTLMLVGAQAGCGTSAMVGNLATSLSLNGQKVLVVDANFRRPSQGQLFNTPTAPGLAEVLEESASLGDAISHVDDAGIDLLPAGGGEATAPEILDGTAFQNLLAKLESDYDVILFDAPPALVASDSKLLCQHLDAVAVVVRAKSEKRGMISRMLRQLEGDRADLLGLILNGVQSSAGGYFRKNYQAFYHYRQTGDESLPS